MGATTDRMALVDKPLTKYDVIVSYAHDDDPAWVNQLVAHLKQNQMRVWFDSELMPGDRWQDEILSALKSFAACMICIGNQKPAGWFKEEIDVALNIANERGRGKLRLFAVLMPLAIDIEVPELPRKHQCLDFRYPADPEPLVKQIITSIRRIQLLTLEDNQQTHGQQLQFQQKQGSLTYTDLVTRLQQLKDLHDAGLISSTTRGLPEQDLTGRYF
jgi:hypothetical protein